MAEWDEEAHPRDEQGRFSGSAGGLASFAKKYGDDAGRQFSRLAVASQKNNFTRAQAALKSLGVAIHEGRNPEKIADPDLRKQRIALANGAGKIPLDEHMKRATEFLDKHEANLLRALESLKTLAPKDARLEGRSKELPSALDKLIRKPHYEDVSKLHDGTGLRVIAKNADDVKTTVAAIKANYKVVSEDDYISKPLAPFDYRSHHLIVEDHDGLKKEIQVRTENQHTFANWAHDVYKPTNETQRAAMKAHADAMEGYARAVSAHYWALDNGRPSTMPKAPDVVRKHFHTPEE